MTTACLDISVRVVEIEAEKSIITPEYHLAGSHTAVDSALLRAVMDATGTYLTTMYNGVLDWRLHELYLNHNDPAKKPEADELMAFKNVLSTLPFSSDSAFLTLAVAGEYRTRKETVTVPPFVAALWDKVLSENAWIPHYVRSAGKVRNQCSRVLHGVDITWKESDVSVALAKSDFSLDVQEALRDIAVDCAFVLVV